MTIQRSTKNPKMLVANVEVDGPVIVEFEEVIVPSDANIAAISTSKKISDMTNGIMGRIIQAIDMC
jgi:hypothetical protein